MSQARNKRTLLLLVAVILAMAGLSFAAVPLYRVFCSRTGYAGTVQRSAQAPRDIAARMVTITFDARTDPSLPWEFKPERNKITLHVGQQGIMNFIGTNLSAQQTTGTAVYNVTPLQIGAYFHKTQCFCFDKQTLRAGQTAHFPVVFYVDPSILKDEEMDDVTDITLSYTFYAADSKALDKAIEAYGQKKKE